MLSAVIIENATARAPEVPELPRRRLSRAQQNEAKRRLLLASALEVLTEQGYQAMTLEEVAERAGFTRRPIYTLFGSKEQLALALFIEQVTVVSRAATDVTPSRTLAGTLKRFARRHTEVAGSPQYRALYELQLSLESIALHDPAIKQEIRTFLDAQHEYLVMWLTNLCEVTGASFRLPIDRVARVMEGSLSGLIHLGFLDERYNKVDLRCELLLALVAEAPASAAKPAAQVG